MFSLALLAGEEGMDRPRRGDQTQVESRMRNGWGSHGGSEAGARGDLGTFLGQIQQGLVTSLMQERGDRKCLGGV